MGDVKMLAMIGAFLGWQLTFVTLMMASLAGSIVGVALIALPARRHEVRRCRSARSSPLRRGAGRDRRSAAARLVPAACGEPRATLMPTSETRLRRCSG